MSLIRDRHIVFYKKIMTVFPYIYLAAGIAPSISSVYPSFINIDLVSSASVALFAFLMQRIAVYLEKRSDFEGANCTIHSTVIFISFFIPIHIIILLMFHSYSSMSSLYYNINMYYMTVFISSMTLYSKRLVYIFYGKNILLSFLIPYILYKNGIQQDLSDYFTPALNVALIGFVQTFSLNYFKINIINELEAQNIRVEEAERKQKETSDYFANVIKDGFGAVIIINKDGIIDYVNEMITPNNYTRHKLIGSHYSEMFDKLGFGDTSRKGTTKEIESLLAAAKPVMVYSTARLEGIIFLVFFTPIIQNGVLTRITLNFRRAY